METNNIQEKINEESKLFGNLLFANIYTNDLISKAIAVLTSGDRVKIQAFLKSKEALSILCAPCNVDSNILEQQTAEFKNLHSQIVSAINRNSFGMYDDMTNPYKYSVILKSKTCPFPTVLDCVFANAHLAHTEHPSIVDKAFFIAFDVILDELNQRSALPTNLEKYLADAMLNAKPEMRVYALQKCPQLFRYLPQDVFRPLSSLQKFHQEKTYLEYLEKTFESVKGSKLKPQEQVTMLKDILSTISRNVGDNSDPMLYLFNQVNLQAQEDMQTKSATVKQIYGNYFESTYEKGMQTPLYVSMFNYCFNLYRDHPEIRSMIPQSVLDSAMRNAPSELKEYAILVCPTLFNNLPLETFKGAAYKSYLTRAQKAASCYFSSTALLQSFEEKVESSQRKIKINENTDRIAELQAEIARLQEENAQLVSGTKVDAGKGK